jgi:hypothetical protein
MLWVISMGGSRGTVLSISYVVAYARTYEKTRMGSNSDVGLNP